MHELKPYKPERIKESALSGIATRRRYDYAHPHLQFLELNEFPKSDPWHNFFEQTIRSQAHVFAGKTILEGGIGNGSLMVEAIFATRDKALREPQRIIGIDINNVGLDLTYHHLVQLGFADSTELWYSDIIQFLKQQNHIPAQVGVFCIPQVPEPFKHRLKPKLRMSGSDSYDPAFIPDEFTRKYNDVGLALIAGTLSELHGKVPNDFTGYFIFSDRIPSYRIDQMVQETGWEIEQEFKTPTPIQQDPDTKLNAYGLIADQDVHHPHFWERQINGSFRPISTKEAINRINQPNVSRDNLNVYHHLSILKLKKSQSNGNGRRGPREYV